MIKTVEKPITVVNFSDYPTNQLPEVVFMGRSNVGKSSLINTLLNRKNLAYTSQNPGKTQTINFYLVNENFYLVDVPGYGYARVSKAQREAFGKMIETYLTQRQELKRVFLLIDARHDPTEDDLLMVNYLQYVDVPFTIVMTKADKLSKNQQLNAITKLRKKLKGIHREDIVLFSSVQNLNRDLLLEKVNAAIKVLD